MKKQNGIMLLLAAVAAICLGVAVWALFFREETVLAPDQAPPAETQAQTIPGDDADDKMEKPEGGSSVSLTFAKEVTIDLSEKTADLLFANPGKSNQDMVLQIIIQNTVIVQSGTLKPGNQVTSLALLDGAAKRLTEGIYEGKFNVLYYDPVTGAKAVVNTEIPIEITVIK